MVMRALYFIFSVAVLQLTTAITAISVAQEPDVLLDRAIKKLEALHANCFVVGKVQHRSILNDKISKDKVKKRSELRILLNIAKSPTMDDGLMVSAVFSSHIAFRVAPPNFPIRGGLSREEIFEVVAKSGSNWYSGNAEELPRLNMTLVNLKRPDDDEVVKQLSTENRIEFASLPLMTYFSLAERNCSLGSVKQMHDPKNPLSFVHRSIDSNVSDGITTGIWIRKNNNALIRILFSSECDNMPVQFEYYSRDVNVPYKEGGEFGKLVYRTTTKWRMRDGIALPQKIEFEVFPGDKQKRQVTTVDCAWATAVNHDLISPDTTIMPFAEGSPIYEKMADLAEELDDVRSE